MKRHQSIRPKLCCLAAAAICCVMYAASITSASRVLQQAGGGAVPQQCIDTGLSLQGDCSDEINTVLKAIGSNVNSADPNALSAAASTVTQDKAALDKALAAFNPGPKCCKAACKFGAALCACDPNVVNLVTSVLQADAATYKQITTQLASKCKFQDISTAAGNCPADLTKTPAYQCPA